MNPYAQRYPCSFSGTDYRKPFKNAQLEVLGCMIDHLYEFADLTRAERLVFLSAHPHLLTVDFELRGGQFGYVDANYTLERPDIPHLSSDPLKQSVLGYLLGIQECADRLWLKYIEERPARVL